MVHLSNFSFLHAKLGYPWLSLPPWAAGRVNVLLPSKCLELSLAHSYCSINIRCYYLLLAPGGMRVSNFCLRTLIFHSDLPNYFMILKRNCLRWKLYRYNLRITRGARHKGTSAGLHRVRHLDSAKSHAGKQREVTGTGAGQWGAIV